MNEIKIADVIKQLHQQEWAVCDHFLDFDLAKSLEKEIWQLWNDKAFKPATVGRERQSALSIRSDHIWWWPERLEQSAPQNTYLNLMEQLQEKIKEEFFLAINAYECHYTFYPAEAYYKKHLDNFADQQNQRILSTILYLNSSYCFGDGGELKIYPKTGEKVIEPIFARFVCFFSKTLPHEVAVTHRERMALTGWHKYLTC